MQMRKTNTAVRLPMRATIRLLVMWRREPQARSDSLRSFLVVEADRTQ